MNCQKAQRLMDDLARNRLGEPEAVAVRQHLADCTDCRVYHQRAARLQRLLALKRYEQPPPGYFDQVLAGFHQRLAEVEQRGSWWDRALASWGLDSFFSPRYSWASACAVLLVAGVCWMGMRNSNEALTASGGD